MLRIRTSGITVDAFHDDHVYKCVNFWYKKKKRQQTKAKENAKMQIKPIEAAKRLKFDICKLSALIDVLLCLTFSLYKVDLKFFNIKFLFSVCL